MREKLGESPGVAHEIDTLIENIGRHRDQDAFRQLFAKMAPRLKGYFIRAGSSVNDSEDLLQDVLLRVWSNAARFDANRASGPTWIFTIARNCMVDRIRRQRRPAPDPEDPLFKSEPASLEIAVDRAREQRTLRGMLDELPPEQADVVRRSFFEGHSLAEIAKITDSPLGTIKTRARLAMKQLRARMRRHTDPEVS